MKINAYLTFNGNCEAAMRFYAQALGGTLDPITRFGDSPACDHVPADHHDKIMHARLHVGDQVLMASDGMPTDNYEGIKGCAIALNVDSAAEAERVFKALSEKGHVVMALEKTFWAVSFGMLVDHFGVSWMINCEREA
ncbi:VOC family protein [Lysobacter sp. TAF61]|uniref:VOC family protein n=1 Tax=Lysobacter sp. TAF61 TaxID=3233072 RepID=UPI003F978E14